ncbi:uncharacterized protein LOC128418386 isoform X2 [Podarcis raffonei]|uniref:uncharacterized protein LOC128418386 isoform X2 n=2 Tax=Podarcis raffonei TaxID=65483 RepID=UPI00232971EB|nr:uncharacterized protein LOC128418386 isoform X2 [Podarcis raffonei]
MEGVALRWRAATVVLQGLLAMTCLISGISALKCHSSSTMNHFTPRKGNTTSNTYTGGGIRNCSHAENVCTDAQLTLTIDKEVLIISYKGCASKDLMDETKSITSGDRHFAIQFDQSYCFGDLCNAKTRVVSKTPIKDKVTGSNQCYFIFGWGSSGSIKETMKCSKDYNRCYQGSMNITIALDEGGSSSVRMILRTCQRSACDVIKSQSFGPINITSESGPCCSGSKCNWKDDGFYFNMRSTAKPNLFSDQDEDVNLGHATEPVTLESGFQGLSPQLCPLLAALGATVLGIWG